MSTPPSQPRASQAAEQLVKQLNVAYKAVRLYPPTSAIPRDSASAAIGTLRAMLREHPDVRLIVTKEGLFHESGAIFPEQPAFEEFTREFFSRRLAEVRFHSGVTVTEMIGFMRILDEKPNDLLSAGGFESRLWDEQVVNITVKEASTRVVDHVELSSDGAVDDGWPPDAQTINDILADLSAGRPRDQVVLVRVVQTPEVLAEFLRDSLGGRGTTPAATWLTSRVSALAAGVAGDDVEDRIERLEAIAGGLMEIDEVQLREVLTDKMLAEARHDTGLAEVIQRIGIERLCDVLAAGFEDTFESREGLTRAFRNLLNISDLGGDHVLGEAGACLERAGLGPEAKSAVLDGIIPAQITTQETRSSEERSQVEHILRLVDMAPVGEEATGDPDREALAAESREGIGDGDVLGALVGLITIEQRDEQFHSLMSVVEDGLSLLVTRQEYEVAAAVTDGLSEAAEDDTRAEPQRERIAAALDGLASKPNTRAIAAAMRRYEPASTEYRACRHLLMVLGRHAIEPLLEILADEPDMTARKGLVALISEMADAHIEELGKRLSDDRWYFVRNIVTILGSTRTDETLQLLARTQRYPDPRVRRETIRAVSGIRDALSERMLVAALDDTDAQNVQLAARYLGLLGVRSAAGPLEDVVAGKGPGNRDTSTRVEAIEALGRLSSARSLPLLRSLGKGRGLRGRARARELAAAAEAAVAAIERTTGDGEVDS